MRVAADRRGGFSEAQARGQGGDEDRRRIERRRRRRRRRGRGGCRGRSPGLLPSSTSQAVVGQCEAP